MQQQKHPASAIVLVIEGVGTNLVGAYGSSTAITPAMDLMASQGVLVDQCFVDSLELTEQLQSLWTAEHAVQRTGPRSETSFKTLDIESIDQEIDSRDRLPASAVPAWNLWSGLSAIWGGFRGAETLDDSAPHARLLTDSPEVAELAERMGCPRVTLVESQRLPEQVAALAEDSAHCALMELLATAANELAHGPPGLVWIHSRALRHPWDAPLSMREQFVDPEDPPPPTTVELPSIVVDSGVDPDFVIGWGQVAAAQTTVVDEAVAALRQAVALRADADQWSWILTTLGGVPLGEHGQLGWGRKQLVGSELQTATIIVPAHTLPIGLRRPELYQLPDIAASIAGLLGLELPDTLWGRDILSLGAAQSPDRWPSELRLAMIVDRLQCWIRSPAWSAVFELGEFDAHRDSLDEKLFVKPEDRWEVSQIADRRRDIVLLHRQLVPLFWAAAQSGQRSLLPNLDEDLLNLLR